MNDFTRNARPGNRSPRPFVKKPYRSSAQGPVPRELYDAECNKCHERCQVPFRPNGKKPVYCANCFTRSDEQAGAGHARAPMAAHASPVPNRQIEDLKRQIETMNGTLEKLVTAVDTFNRATALTKEIRRHFPADKPAPAPKKAATKKVTKAAKAPKKARTK